MPNRTEQKSPTTVEFSNFGRRVVEGHFDGGSMTSDGGVMLLNETALMATQIPPLVATSNSPTPSAVR